VGQFEIGVDRIIGIIGFYLLVDALAFFNFFGLVEVTHPGGAGSPAE